MKRFTKRQWAVLFPIGIVAGSLLISFQNFTPSISIKGDGLKHEAASEDSLTAALAAAEKDHVDKQMAMNVEPGQIEKTLKKERTPATVEVPTDNVGDTAESAMSLKPNDDFDFDKDEN